MNKLRYIALSVCSSVVLLQGCGGGGSSENVASHSEPIITFPTTQALGEALFHDVNLSLKRTQSCSSCHDQHQGFVDTRNEAPMLLVNKAVSVGDDGQTLGSRNAPTLTYAHLTPVFSKNDHGEYIGGFFHDGRAANLAAQAGAPPVNPSEMMMPDQPSVVTRIKENTSYIQSFKQLFGESIFENDATAYTKMAESIAAYVANPAEFSTFDSKYDRSLLDEKDPNYYQMDFLEQAGMNIFFSNNNINCISCHQLKTTFAKEEVFTNYKYHNIGTPNNTLLAQITANNQPDAGLMNNPRISRTDAAEQAGKFKVPTLRNIAVTGPYMHNGVFNELRTVLAFYDHMRMPNNPDRPLNPETGFPWGESPYPNAVDHALLAMNTPLTDANINALIAFLNTLTDRRFEGKIPKQQ